MKRKHAPKVKKVRLPEAVMLHVEAPPDHTPLIIHGPDPHHVRVVPVPKEVPKGFWESLGDSIFGTEKK